jgi:long-chain fatty acid transport protein
MKKFLPILGLIYFVLFIPLGFVFAGAYEFGGLGPRATGMGGAFIGVADDWTAPYWNPAGLTQSEGSGLGIELLLPKIKIVDGNSIANSYPHPDSINEIQGDVFVQVYTLNEPNKFVETEVTGFFYQPFIGGFLDFQGIKVGAGFYIPVGNWVDWEDRVLDVTGADTIDATYFASMNLMVGNLSAAKEIMPGFSFGAGVNVLFINNEYKATKSYISTNPMMPSYDFLHKMDGSGKDFEFIFGLLYKPLPNFSIGGVYRTGSEIELNGTGNYSLTFEAPAPSPPPEESEYTMKFYHPATYGVGIAFSPMPDLLITADWQGTNWKTWKTIIDYETEGQGLKNQYIDWGWEMSNRYRFGTEYKPNDIVSLRAGFYYDESPAPDEQMSLTGINDVARTAVTFGAGYKWENLHFDLVYEYQTGEREVENVKYSVTAYAVTLGLFLVFY